MAIERLFVRNFKGIADLGWLDIRPITLFIGANSSGKSSCLHALAALSQTAKLPNNSRPLILDDEYAQVHLGRFIDVIHTRSYSNEIELGADPGPLQSIGGRASDKKQTRSDNSGNLQIRLRLHATDPRRPSPESGVSD